MNYEKLTKLAELLDKHHGQPKQIGFIVAPESEAQIKEHRSALIHTDCMFHYQPESDERLCIISVTREETVGDDSSVKVDYTPTRLETMEYEALCTTPEISPLLMQYIEYTKAKPA
jgi:hypothetical protein